MAPKEGPEMSTTSSEVVSIVRHRAKKTACDNRVLTSDQRNALQIADERAKTMHLAFKDMLDVFSGDMKARNYRE